MVECPRCGNYHSGYPNVCPYCGYPLVNDYAQNSAKVAKTMKNFIAAVFVLLFFVSIGWIIISYLMFHDVNYIGIVLLIISIIMLAITPDD